MSMKTRQLRLHELKHLKGTQCPGLAPACPFGKMSTHKAPLIQTRQPVPKEPGELQMGKAG